VLPSAFEGVRVKIHLVSLRQGAYDAIVRLHQKSQPQLHALVTDPEDADMILFVGGWPPHGQGVVDSPLPKKYSEKTFIYMDDDGFVPLLPGVYPNAEKRRFWNLPRYESQIWIDVLNPHIKPMQREKKYLFSFTGGSTSIVRKRLYKVNFNRTDVLVENTSSYYHWDPEQAGKAERQIRYAEVIASSHYGLVPKGASAGSLRLWEVMQMEVAPVVVSDRWMLPYGPDWASFAIRIPERKLKQLDTIIEKYLPESAHRGKLARAAYDEWFAPPVFFNRVIESCERAKANRRIPERWIHPFWGYMLWRARLKYGFRAFAKKIILGAFRVAGKRFIYDLNRDEDAVK
jgi:hypothetical protein